MKIYLPVVTLVVLTFVTSVHSRAIHRFRRSLYYANETGKDGELGKPLPQEGTKDVPITTTIIPVSISSSVREDKPEDVPHVKEDEETTKVTIAAVSQLDDVESKGTETTSAAVTTAKESEVIPESDLEKDQPQDKPEERQVADEEDQKLDKREESVSSTTVKDPLLQEKVSTIVDEIPQVTKEPESSSTKQDTDDSHKKLEVVTETKKEGRSGTDEPLSEITSPVSVEDAPKPSEEQEKVSDDKEETETQKHSEETEHAPNQPESTTLVPSTDEKQEQAVKSSEVETDSPIVTSLEKKSADEKLPLPSLKEDEEPTKHAPSTEVLVEDSKSEVVSVIIVSSTPQAIKQESTEDIADITEKKIEDEVRKDTDLPSVTTDTTHNQQKEQDIIIKSDALPEFPLKEEEKDEAQTTTVSSDSPREEAKEAEKEVTPTVKAAPSKRFADWLDYVPRDF